MPQLVPSNHVPVSFATVYLIACVLHEQSNKPRDEPADEYFQRYWLPFATSPRFTPGPNAIHPDAVKSMPVPRRTGLPPAFRQDLVAVAIELVPSSEKPINPYAYDAVRIVFRDAEGGAFSPPVEGASWNGTNPFYHLSVTLRPPFTTCLSPGNTVPPNTDLMRAMSPLPEGFELKFPPFEDETKTRYRQALATSVLSGVLLEGNGCLTPIPSDYWRSEAAESVFLEDKAITVHVDSRTATGLPLVDLAVLRDGWRSAFYMAPAGIRMAERSFSPYLDFLLDVANDLKMVDGCDASGERISHKVISARIEQMWDQRPDLGNRSANKVKGMATMLRHPDLEAGGNEPGEVLSAKRKAKVKADPV